MTNEHAAGASKSLKQTTKVIMKFLKDRGDRPQSGLRGFLHEKLGDLAEKWYRRGFKRGHIESDKQLDDGKVPRTLRCDATREFFYRR